MAPTKPKLPVTLWGGRSPKGYLPMGIGFPGLFAGPKETEGHERYEGNLLCDQRRNHHGLPSNGICRQIANAHGGAADPYESMESRPSRASGRAGHRAKGSRHPGGMKEPRPAICWHNVVQSNGRENELSSAGLERWVRREALAQCGEGWAEFHC